MERNLDELPTEKPTPNSEYESRSTRELVGLMNDEDAVVPDAVRTAAGQIASAIDAIVERLAAGGRLVYSGAGASGAIAALDADECEATFSTKPGQVVALVAGEDRDSVAARAAAEDEVEGGAAGVHRLELTAADAFVGVSASGRTPYVVGAMEAAAAAGALTVALVCVPDSPLADRASHVISVVVGPEFIAGSTRLKAGTAQKLVLNMISTISMIRLGRTFGNLMVDVNPANEKLRARAAGIVSAATGVSSGVAQRTLAAADGNAKVAIVSLLAGVDPETARAKLSAANEDIRAAVRG
jgi:N-acetylmuramic acid 6-phosphate etherase